MKKIITAVMAGMTAISMTGCAGIRPYADIVKENSANYAAALVSIGDVEYTERNYKMALAHYDEALKLCEKRPVFLKIAYCLKKLGNTADAKMVYKKALEIAPEINEKNQKGGTVK